MPATAAPKTPAPLRHLLERDGALVTEHRVDLCRAGREGGRAGCERSLDVAGQSRETDRIDHGREPPHAPAAP